MGGESDDSGEVSNGTLTGYPSSAPVQDGEEVAVYASARSFLHHQVRSMVGTIEMAGAGRWSLADVRAALEARDRRRCGRTAPAAGLCLIGVDYPSEAVAP